MEEETKQALRNLPAVEELLQSQEASPLLEDYPRERVVDALRVAVDRVRREIKEGDASSGGQQAESAEILSRTAKILNSWFLPHLRGVINVSGVVVHTNLGRSCLAAEAMERVREAATHYTNLEFSMDRGERGSRHEHVESLLVRLTGAEAGMVVNNNAAAVLLLLSELAAGQEVIVSRGQLVEIGGSFRIPDIMRQSGAHLVEVGTTNKTRIADYEAAVTERTSLLLRVHTSNFKVLGFSEEVGVEHLAKLGRELGIPVADDLGSGALLDLPAFADEPSVHSSLRGGADVVSFSGDKLLGGPQAGILVGKTAVINRLKTHPLARALRVDKMTLAALEGTLLLYQDPERARRSIPTLRYLDRPEGEIEELAVKLLAMLRSDAVEVPKHVELRVIETVARAGGGALPLLELPSRGVAVTSSRISADELARRLRQAEPPVVCRVSGDSALLDVRSLEEEDLPALAGALSGALAGPPADGASGGTTVSSDSSSGEKG